MSVMMQQRVRPLGVMVALGLLAVLVAVVAIGRGSGPSTATVSQDRGAPEQDDVVEPDVEVLAAGDERVADEDADVRGDGGDEPPARDAAPVADVRANLGFVGEAEADLPSGDPNVVIIPDASGAPDGAIPPQAPNLADGSRPTTGWDIEDVRFRYDAQADALVVVVNSYGVVGDPEGNGDPSVFDQAWTDAGLGGSDAPDLGDQEAVVLMLDLDQDGQLDVFAGTNYATDLQTMTVASASPLLGAAAATVAGLPIAWGEPIQTIGHYSEPAADAPDLAFVISDFSSLAGAVLDGPDPDLDFGANLFMGSGADGNIGEDTLAGSALEFIPIDVSAEIGDFVFADDNRNGIQDAGEEGVGGVDVILFDDAGNEVDRRTTDGDGRYLFTVAPGTYSLRFVAPVGSSLTVARSGDDAARDSNPTPSSGRTAAITVTAGQTDLTIDAGLVAFVPNPGIDIEKATNGADADLPEGEELIVGDEVTFTYEVRNTGNMELRDVQVVDDLLGPVSCPTDVLPVGGGFTCVATSVVVEGAYVNVGSVTGQPVGPDGIPVGSPVTDDDPSHHIGVVPPAPAISLEKATNGWDADLPTGPELEVGSTATFTYAATNDGNVDLTDVLIRDDVLGFVCRIDLLTPGESDSCSATAVVVEGQYRNLGSVSAIPTGPDGEPLGEPVTAEDPSHHVGVVTGPACVTSIRGPRMWAGATTVDETGWVAAAGSTIRIVTDEPGGSPEQPNEQVYVFVGEDRYGPTPAGLGEFEFTVGAGGPVTIRHWSEVSGDTSRPNSVEYEWCGTALSRPTVHACPDVVVGPRMFKGDIVRWDTGLTAAPGSTIEVTTSEPGASPDQPNERVYLIVGGEVIGATAAEHGTHDFVVGAGGAVVIAHWSEFHESDLPNSVEVSLCGTALREG